jgi:hypothetical protein
MACIFCFWFPFLNLLSDVFDTSRGFEPRSRFFIPRIASTISKAIGASQA